MNDTQSNMPAWQTLRAYVESVSEPGDDHVAAGMTFFDTAIRFMLVDYAGFAEWHARLRIELLSPIHVTDDRAAREFLNNYATMQRAALKQEAGS